MSGRLEGRVVAIIGAGTDADRAIAVACAEEGAGIAIASLDRSQAQEFATNSIANEVWVIGRDHFVRVMDATDPTAVMAFADEVCDRLGRVDVVVANHDLLSAAPLDELSPDEWDAALRVNLTGPFLAAHAFGRVMERAGGGLLVFVTCTRTDADAAYAAAKAGLAGLASAVQQSWAPRGVNSLVVAVSDGTDGKGLAAAVLEAASGAVRR